MTKPNKTQPTKASVAGFISAIEDDIVRADCKALLGMMKRVTGEKPVLWGGTMIGFGRYTYKYASGHGGEWFMTGFAPRKGMLTIYILPSLEQLGPHMAKLGPHKTGKCCLYVKRLSDIDPAALEGLLAEGVARMRRWCEEQARKGA